MGGVAPILFVTFWGMLGSVLSDLGSACYGRAGDESVDITLARQIDSQAPEGSEILDPLWGGLA